MTALALAPACVARLYREACRFDVIAFKPGNVSCEAAGHGMRAGDFLLSAAVSATALTQPGGGVGERLLRAVQATRAAVGCNTNLGILLLAAPLVLAALSPAGEPAVRPRLRRVLGELRVADAEFAYAAIRTAAPGGLGEVAEHSVYAPATVDLRAAMALAAPYDVIARQYCNDYAEVFEVGLPALAASLAAGDSLAHAVSRVYLRFLATLPDSHVGRKRGAAVAEALRQGAGELGEARKAGQTPRAWRAQVRRFDRELKAAGLNPGTSADLTVASLFAYQLGHALGG
ncbi:MAG: triphosphoribosyl-dephospho-CoA protein [Gammaproteobacteria bacterium]|nr:triphosphoribosyl-dephospho-CoA protein [Gammaproteobacteria bacterium]